MSQKRIPITALKVGMFVCGLDRSWLHTPFFTHRFLIQDETQIDKLKQSGIQAVDIDIGRGLDIEKTAGLPSSSEATLLNNQTAAAQESPIVTIVPEESQEPLESQPPLTRPEDAKPPWVMAKAFHAARGFRQELLKRVDSMLHSLAENSTIESQQVREVVQEIIAKAIENQAAFLALVRTRDFDPTLRDHLLSVSTLAAIVGKALHYTPQQLEHLATGAMLHDVGLLRLPHYMYRLPQSLKKGERDLYESHPRLGSSLLQRSGGFPEPVINIVLEHHETAGDGRAASSKQISESSRLVMVIDRYDELLTGQTEQAPIPPQQALSRLYQEAQGGRLDMPSVSHLIRVIGVYPLYSLVALNTGERGIVTALTPGKLHQPVIAVFHGPDGEAHSPPFLVDLSQQPAETKARSIVATLDIDQEGINLEAILSQFEPAMANTTPDQDT